MSLIDWEPFPGRIVNEAGVRLFVQTFLGPFNGVGLQEDAKVCLRSCMLHSVPPPPPGGNRLEASLRDNLTLSSFSELIVVVVDLAKGHAYIRGNIVVNRPVVVEALIPRLVDLTGTPPCRTVFLPSHQVPMWRSGCARLLHSSSDYSPGVCHIIHIHSVSPAECLAYGVTPATGYSTSYYTTGVNPQMSQAVIASSFASCWSSDSSLDFYGVPALESVYTGCGLTKLPTGELYYGSL